MSHFPFLHVDPDFLKPMRSPSRTWSPESLDLFRIFFPPFGEALPYLNQNNLDEAPEDLISKAIEHNDKNRLIQILKKRKVEPLPLPANRDNQNWTALHLAASKPEYRECLELLFEYDGRNILVNRDSQTSPCLGETALHIACKFGCEENVLVLLKNGCDPEKKTSAGYTALHIAASKGYGKIAQYLIGKNAFIDSITFKGRTPLHLAVKAGHLDVVDFLLRNKASSSATDRKGNVPLHFACKNGTFEIGCLLVDDNSVLINARDSDGITPFMLAVGNFDLNGIKYFLENGARADISDDLGRMVLHFATSQKNIQSFALLIQSMDVSLIEQCCVSNIIKVANREPPMYLQTFDSFTCLGIQMGPDYLNLLLNSQLPKSVLQMPSLTCDIFDGGMAVFSPLAYLFFQFAIKRISTFDECLDLLLKHQITTMDEFKRVLQPEWPNSCTRFINPLSILVSSVWPSDSRRHYFNLLLKNNVTTDYCLQTYHNSDESFVTFKDYQVYYSPIIYAIEKGNIEVVKLFISNSDILEPDVLCNYLIMAYAKNKHLSPTDEVKARSLYQYLISLKPVYHKWNQQSNQYDLQRCPFMPAVEKFSDEDLAKFHRRPYVYQQSPFFAETDDYNSSWYQSDSPLDDFQPFPFVTPAEEFASVTLKQLCRTAIRQQLREPTLEDNLRNFRQKIPQLGLPKSVEEYLLFKQ